MQPKNQTADEDAPAQMKDAYTSAATQLDKLMPIIWDADEKEAVLKHLKQMFRNIATQVEGGAHQGKFEAAYLNYEKVDTLPKLQERISTVEAAIKGYVGRVYSGSRTLQVLAELNKKIALISPKLSLSTEEQAFDVHIKVLEAELARQDSFRDEAQLSTFMRHSKALFSQAHQTRSVTLSDRAHLNTRYLKDCATPDAIKRAIQAHVSAHTHILSFSSPSYAPNLERLKLLLDDAQLHYEAYSKNLVANAEHVGALVDKQRGAVKSTMDLLAETQGKINLLRLDLTKRDATIKALTLAGQRLNSQLGETQESLDAKTALYEELLLEVQAQSPSIEGHAAALHPELLELRAELSALHLRATQSVTQAEVMREQLTKTISTQATKLAEKDELVTTLKNQLDVLATSEFNIKSQLKCQTEALTKITLEEVDSRGKVEALSERVEALQVLLNEAEVRKATQDTHRNDAQKDSARLTREHAQLAGQLEASETDLQKWKQAAESVQTMFEELTIASGNQVQLHDTKVQTLHARCLEHQEKAAEALQSAQGLKTRVTCLSEKLENLQATHVAFVAHYKNKSGQSLEGKDREISKLKQLLANAKQQTRSLLPSGPSVDEGQSNAQAVTFLRNSKATEPTTESQATSPVSTTRQTTRKSWGSKKSA